MHPDIWQYGYAFLGAVTVYSVLGGFFRAIFPPDGRSGAAAFVAIVVPFVITGVASLYAWHAVFDMYGGRPDAINQAAIETNQNLAFLVSYIPSIGGAVKNIVLGG